MDSISVNENIIKVVEEDTKKPLSNKLRNILILSATVISIFYSICFYYTKVPQISFTVFSIVTFSILYFVLKKGGFIKNKSNIYGWFAAVFALALCNGIFSYNGLTYSNIFVMILLISCFTLNVSVRNPTRLYSIKIVKNIFFLLFGSKSNWITLPKAIKSLQTKEDNSCQSNKLPYNKMLKGILYSIPFLVIINLLLTQSDLVFFTFSKKVFLNISSNFYDKNIIGVILVSVLTFIYFIGYIYNLNQIKENVYNIVKVRSVDKTTAVTFLCMINALFLVFSVVQFTFLFTGGYVTLPDNISYSDYARKGFFELLFVTIINFSVILFFTRYIKTLRTSKLVKYLLVALCFFTGILIVSSFYRMGLYINAHDYTSLRLKVITFLIMETILIIGTIKYLLKQKFNLVKFFLITGFVFYLVVNVTSSDYVTTMLNINRLKNNQSTVIDLDIVGKDGAGLVLDLYQSKWFRENRYPQLDNMNVDLLKVEPSDRWQEWSLLASISYDKKMLLDKKVVQ